MSARPAAGTVAQPLGACWPAALGLLASWLCLVPASPAGAAEPVEDMGCRLVIWAAVSVYEHNSDHVGMRHMFRGCLVKRGWSTKAYRALENRQWRLNIHLSSAERRNGG